MQGNFGNDRLDAATKLASQLRCLVERRTRLIVSSQAPEHVAEIHQVVKHVPPVVQRLMNLVAATVVAESFRVSLLLGERGGDLAIGEGDLRLIVRLLSHFERLLKIAERRLVIAFAAIAAPEIRQTGVNGRAVAPLLEKVER